MHHMRTERKDAIFEPHSGSSPDRDSASTLTLSFSVSRGVNTVFLLFIIHLVCYSVALVPQADKASFICIKKEGEERTRRKQVIPCLELDK